MNTMLSTLTGTDKQISFAAPLRDAMIEAIDLSLNTIDGSLGVATAETADRATRTITVRSLDVRAGLEAIRGWLASETDAAALLDVLTSIKPGAACATFLPRMRDAAAKGAKLPAAVVNNDYAWMLSTSGTPASRRIATVVGHLVTTTQE